jgi:hypothetical protein
MPNSVDEAPAGATSIRTVRRLRRVHVIRAVIMTTMCFLRQQNPLPLRIPLIPRSLTSLSCLPIQF